MNWPRLIQTLGWVHVHLLWQALLIAGVLSLALWILPTRRAVVRYTLCCLALGLVALAPVVTLVARLPARGGALAHEVETISTPFSEVAGIEEPPSGRLEGGLRSGFPYPLERTFPWALLVWGCGVTVLSLANLRAWSRARGLARAELIAPPGAAARCFEDLLQRLRLSPAVGLWQSAHVQGPLTLGWWRPVVLLPASAFTGLSPRELEAVLAHELAHVRRHDYLVNLLQVAVETLFFHHPAVWWISHRMRVEREHCCDDIAVASCGDARVYAFALSALEHRRSAPAFAHGATGGPLLQRIRRILGAPPTTPDPSLRGPATMLTLTCFASIAVYFAASPAAGLPQEDSVRVPVLPEEEAAGQDSTLEEVTGLWLGRLNERDLRLELRPRTDRKDSWGHSIRIPLTSLPELELGDGLRLTLTREAGELHLVGDLLGRPEEADGTGRFTFTPAPAFAKGLRELGFGRLESRDAFLLGIHDVTLAFARKARELGPDVDIETLVKFSIHGVTSDFIEGMRERGLEGFDAEALVTMRIHDVTLEYADGMKVLFGDRLEVKDLVSFKIHGVTPEFAREVSSLGYPGVTPDELRSLRIHGVSPELMRTVDSLLQEKPTIKGITSLRIHGATPEFMREMAQRFGTAKLGDFVELRIHGVSAEYCDELTTLGVTDADVRGFVKMRIHGVSARWLTKQIEAGLTDLSVESVVRRKIHG